ncbi:MAG: hypothetical protein PHS14_18645 [Elusimicrobia bacterium]|nr:hypothetical protein [Elusimicrobiota bacterium]
MTRPDPATASFAEIVNALFDRLDVLEDRVQGNDGQLYSPYAAASRLRIGRNYFVSKPWRIPRFGAGIGRYTLSEYRSWLDIPEAVRRRDWEAKPEKERANLRGAA